MKAQRAALKAKIAELPQVKAAARRRRHRRIALLIVLLLLLLFIRCECEPGMPMVIEVDAGTPVVMALDAGRPKPVVKPKGPMQAKVSLGQRDAFGSNQRTSPDWLDSFRLQVAARSPRLAECFQGTERPGALRWVAAVNPESGSVSDQTFEPIGASLELTRDQRTCISRVLSSPPFKLVLAQPDQALLNRVSMVIEF